jgi:hypothetical protein
MARNGRALGAFALIALGVLLAVVANIAVWTKDVVLDTDEYLSVVAPLADDRQVTDAVATLTVDRLLTLSDAEQRTQQALDEVLPTEGRFLAAAVVAGVRQVAVQAVERVLASPEFTTIWTEANRIAHQQLVAALLDRDEAVVRQGGDGVQLDLSPVIAAAETQLQSLGAGQLLANVPVPQNALSITIAEGDELRRAQRAARLLDTVGTWLPILAAALIIGGILVSSRRRATLVNAMIALAVGMLATLMVLRIARPLVLGELQPGLPKALGTDIWEAASASLRATTIVVLVLALVVALLGWRAGPGHTAVRVRSLARDGGRGAGRAARAAYDRRDEAGAAIGPYMTAIRIGVVVLALVVLILLPGLGWIDVLITLVVVGLVLAALEALAPGRGGPPSPDARPVPGPEAGASQHDSPY